MIELYNLSQESIELVDKLNQLGHEIVIEFRPKVDWPKEDEKFKDERYIVACSVNNTWIIEEAPCPNEAIQKVYVRIES